MSDVLQEARERFRICQEAEKDNRDQALIDLKFKTGDQWPEDVITERTKQGRPMLTVNRLPQFVRQVVNEQRQTRPGIHVRPVDDKGDRDTADVFEGLIRHIENQSQAETVFDCALEQAASSGFGYFRIITEYADDSGFDQEIFIKRIKNPFTVYVDPNCEEWDCSDARYAFVTEMIPRDEFKRRYPKASTEGFTSEGVGTAYEGWWDAENVRVAEYWRRVPKKRYLCLMSDGTTLETARKKEESENIIDQHVRKVYAETGQLVEKVRERVADSWVIEQKVITATETLEDNEWAGRFIPIIRVVGDETNVDGKDVRSGIIRNARDSQRMYNYFRSTAAEYIGLAPKAPWVLSKDQLTGYEGFWKRANETLPYLLYNHQQGAPKPERVGMPTQVSGVMQEALMAADDMKGTIGMYDPSLGQKSNEVSGIAIAQREQQADTGTFHYVDNLNRAIAYAGRILVDLVPKIYDTERQIRILNPDMTQQFVQINREYMDENGKIKLYDLSVGRYDVYVEAGPSFATKRQEAVDFLLKLIDVYPAAAPALADLVAQNVDLAGADEAVERLKALAQSQGLLGPAQGAPGAPGQLQQPNTPGVPPQGIMQ